MVNVPDHCPDLVPVEAWLSVEQARVFIPDTYVQQDNSLHFPYPRELAGWILQRYNLKPEDSIVTNFIGETSQALKDNQPRGIPLGQLMLLATCFHPERSRPIDGLGALEDYARRTDQVATLLDRTDVEALYRGALKAFFHLRPGLSDMQRYVGSF